MASRASGDLVRVQCCVAGGGPAGMLAAVLLARAGVQVLVLEKHGDFLRDFRGDTLHPSTLEVMHELGALDPLLRRPHQRAEDLAVDVEGRALRVASFRHLPTHCRFIALMPQWDFLDFLTSLGRRWPGFALRMPAEVIALQWSGERVVGVGARTPEGVLDVRADLVIGADGRDSLVRDLAGLPVEALAAPIDVLWFRLPRTAADTPGIRGWFRAGAVFVMIDRDTYWQCGYVIAKGEGDRLRSAGLDAFRRRVADVSGLPLERAASIRSWDDVKQLAVRLDRLRQWWKPGLLCIGDAAHAMSPVGGVGINLAIQDAVAAANAIALPLREGRLTVQHLTRVQRRRTPPTRLTQWLQRQAQDRVVTPVLHEHAALRPPLALRLLARTPFLQRLSGRLIGLGIRPEHVRTPDASMHDLGAHHRPAA